MSSDDLAALERRARGLRMLKATDADASPELDEAIQSADAELERLRNSPHVERFGDTEIRRKKTQDKLVTRSVLTKQIDCLMAAIAPVLREFVTRTIDERMKQFRHCGTWDAREKYFAGNGVIHHGSSFVALVDSTGVEPAGNENGESGDKHWQMSAKRGRNGKDAGR